MSQADLKGSVSLSKRVALFGIQEPDQAQKVAKAVGRILKLWTKLNTHGLDIQQRARYIRELQPLIEYAASQQPMSGQRTSILCMALAIYQERRMQQNDDAAVYVQSGTEGPVLSIGISEVES